MAVHIKVTWRIILASCAVCMQQQLHWICMQATPCAPWASGGFERIKVENPVVDLDGDEMTRWAMMFGKHRRRSVNDPVVVMAIHRRFNDVLAGSSGSRSKRRWRCATCSFELQAVWSKPCNVKFEQHGANADGLMLSFHAAHPPVCGREDRVLRPGACRTGMRPTTRLLSMRRMPSRCDVLGVAAMPPAEAGEGVNDMSCRQVRW